MHATRGVRPGITLVAACLAWIALAILPAQAATVQLQNATADRSQSGFPVSNVLTPNNAGWAAHTGVESVAQTAAFETVTDVGTAGQTTLLTFYLDHQSPYTTHNLGKFRLSVTTDDRSQFADGLTGEGGVNPGDVTANWVPIIPKSVATVGSTSVQIGSDGSILLSGANPNFDTYVVTAATNLSGITGIRLEAMEDPSLPTNGPGRSSNGNYVLTHLAMDASPTGAVPASHRITFDQSPSSPAPGSYVPGPGEILPGGATMTLRGTPNLVATPAVGGTVQGGGAVQSQALGTNQGYAVTGAGLTGSYTAEVVFMTNTLSPASGFADLINSEGAGGGNGQTILRMIGNGNLQYYPLYAGGGANNSTDTTNLAEHIVGGQMQHVAIVYEQTSATSGVGTLYINGIPQGVVSRTGVTAASTFSGNFAVGNNLNTGLGNRNLDGYVDAFAVTPAALQPSQFAYANLKMVGYDGASNDAGLAYHPAKNDLLAGMTATSSIPLSTYAGLGTTAVLTDGNATNGHPEFFSRCLANDNPADWVLTYDFTTKYNDPVRINEIRVFSQNTDARVFQDYDMEVSDDGVTWSLLKEDVTNGTAGVSRNYAYGTGGDIYHDFFVTALRQLDGEYMTDPIHYLRLTFHPVTGSGDGALFAPSTGDRHTMLYEIDVFGQTVPEPCTIALAALALAGLAGYARRRRSC